MRGTIFTLILFVSSVNFSQTNRVIEGKIVDWETRERLELVNIKFLEREIGTITTK